MKIRRHGRFSDAFGIGDEVGAITLARVERIPFRLDGAARMLPSLECQKRWSVVIFPANPAVTGLFARAAALANKTPVRSLPPLDRFHESVRQLDPRALAGRNSNSCMSREPLAVFRARIQGRVRSNSNEHQ
jgi:hypothetical protein